MSLCRTLAGRYPHPFRDMKRMSVLAQFLLITLLIGAASGHLRSERLRGRKDGPIAEDIPVVGVGSVKPINRDGSSNNSYIAADLIYTLERYDQYSGEYNILVSG